jgi:hypothetical protein
LTGGIPTRRVGLAGTPGTAPGSAAIRKEIVMAAAVVLGRIDAWERAGTIDHELAERLRAIETAEPGAMPESQPPVAAAAPAARIPSSGFILEFFAYLGALFLLLAWYALLNDQPSMEVDRDLAIGIAALVPAVLLGTVGWILASRDEDRLRRAAAVALVAAVPNAGVATWSLLQAAGVEQYNGGPATLVAGAGVAFAVAIAARVRRPSTLTQGVLVAAWAVFALELASWAEGRLWGPESDGGASRSPDQERVRTAVRLGWWWFVAAAPAIVLVLRPDRRPGHESREAVARIGIGTIAVVGSTFVALATYNWGEPIFGTWPAAGIMLGVGAVFVVAARVSGSRIHLVTAGAAILVGLTYLNIEFVVDAVGAPAAFLVEGLILLGVAALGWAAGRLITRHGTAPAG